MKTKSTKQPRQTNPAVHLQDLAAKKNPKAGESKCPVWMCGTNHNETLASDDQP